MNQVGLADNWVVTEKVNTLLFFFKESVTENIRSEYQKWGGEWTLFGTQAKFEENGNKSVEAGEKLKS